MNFGIRFVRSNMAMTNGNSNGDLVDKGDLKLLSGEELKFKEQTNEGSILLTNYRVILQYNSSAVFNITIGVIDIVEVRKIYILHVFCKDTRSYKCTFSNAELTLEWQRRIEAVSLNRCEIENIFAFVYYEKLCSENPDLHSLFTTYANASTYALRSDKIFEDESRRLGFDLLGSWRVSKANENHELCTTYPQKLIVPSSISDMNLDSVAKFRSSRRIPAVVWRHTNGAIIARSSQPEVGVWCWRSSEDEGLLKSFAEACAYDCPPNPLDHSSIDEFSKSWERSPDSKRTISGSSDDTTPSICDLPEAKNQSEIKKLLIIDARSYGTAIANRARGGGCEFPDYYPTCEIQFMNLDNIHCIRKSQASLRLLLSQPNDNPNYYSQLESSRWLSHLAGLIKGALTIATAITQEARPVLVHCSDGWDRTPQLTALAQLLMDPFYRTIEGFQILVEREWIEFGHKFSDRCGCGFGTDDANERSPIFLQWLDCVHQLQLQFPLAFQFNQSFLVKLSQHVYSNMFGTFLFNSSMKRIKIEQSAKFYSVWAIFDLNPHQYLNRLYKSVDQPSPNSPPLNSCPPFLDPRCSAKDMRVWEAVYATPIAKNLEEDSEAVDCKAYPQEEEQNSEFVTHKMSKTRSYEDLKDMSPVKERRNSDPSIRDGVTNMSLLTSAIGVEIISDQPHQSDCDPVYNCVTDGNQTPFPCSEDKINVPPLNHLTAEETRWKQSIEGSTDTLVSENGFHEDHDKKQQPQRPSPREVALRSSSKKLGLVSLQEDSREECPTCHSRKEVGIQRQNSRGNRHFTPGHSRSPSSGVSSTPSNERTSPWNPEKNQSVDGLANFSDEISRRLEQVNYQHQVEVETLKRELATIKLFCAQISQTKRVTNGQEIKSEDQVSLPESVGSGGSSGMSDVSWENVDDGEPKTVLWVPDHSVDRCQGCNAQFWVVNRRHHCRSCGKVFCSNCSDQNAPIPRENIHDPVRVCGNCMSNFLDLKGRAISVTN